MSKRIVQPVKGASRGASAPPSPKLLHRARGVDPDDGSTVWWVSIDAGWLSVDGLPEDFDRADFEADEEDYAKVAAIFGPIEMGEPDAKGRKRYLRRMVFATRYVVGKWGAGATLLPPIEIGRTD